MILFYDGLVRTCLAGLSPYAAIHPLRHQSTLCVGFHRALYLDRSSSYSTLPICQLLSSVNSFLHIFMLMTRKFTVLVDQTMFIICWLDLVLCWRGRQLDGVKSLTAQPW